MSKNETFGDRQRLCDMLFSQSGLCAGYNYAASKATTKKFHDEITTLLYEEHRIEIEIARELIRRGFCSEKAADAGEISRAKQEFSALLLSM